MKKIVLCGSMAFIDKMREHSETLLKMGFIPVVPDEDNWNEISEAKINDYKAKVSRRHFDKIADKNTHSILVINEAKNNTDNYIGANTFAEIALAFYFGKEIYLLNGIYKPYSDELLAWGCRGLNGNLSKINA